VIWNPTADGYRLPTEAEWEYACRAGATTALANGDLIAVACNADPNLTSLGWYCGNTTGTTSAAGQKAANAYGLFDMNGNVWEWVWDWYGAYTAASANNPTGPDTGLFKVIRGGGWLYGAQRCRSAHRRPAAPGSVSSDLGFRIVRNDTISTTAPTVGHKDRKSIAPTNPAAAPTSSQPGGRP